MPTYEFYCEKCKKAFNVAISISDYEKKKVRQQADFIISDSNFQKKLAEIMHKKKY